jgi:uncharacterized protein (TIGR02001 family)
MKIKTIILLTFVAFLNLTVAQESESTLNADLVMTPKYVWRGITYSDGLVYQPSLALTQKQFSIQLWGNFVLNDKNNIPGNEIDVYITYNFNLAGFSFAPALFLYTYPGQEANTTTEFSLTAGYEFEEFNLSTSISKDLVETPRSLFASLDLKYSKELMKNLSIDLSTGTGFGNEYFNDYYVGVSKNALNYYMLGGSLKYSLTQNISVRTYFENYWLLDSEIKDSLGGDTFNFGFALGVEL